MRPCSASAAGLGGKLQRPVEPVGDDVAGAQHRLWPPRPRGRHVQPAPSPLRGRRARRWRPGRAGRHVRAGPGPVPLRSGRPAAPRSRPRAQRPGLAPSWSRVVVSGLPTSGPCSAESRRSSKLDQRGCSPPRAAARLPSMAAWTRAASAAALRAADPSCPSCSATADSRASDSCSRTSAAIDLLPCASLLGGGALRQREAQALAPVRGGDQLFARPRRQRPAPRAGSARATNRLARRLLRAGRRRASPP